jgi:hypothetical protein
MVPPEALQLAEAYRIDTLSELHLPKNRLEQTAFLAKCQFDSLLVLNLSR